MQYACWIAVQCITQQGFWQGLLNPWRSKGVLFFSF
jgi:hypothetical protein